MSDPDLSRALAAALGASGPVRPTALRPVSGGCIHETYLVDLPDGGRRFVKCRRRPPRGMFEAEAAGLSALAAVKALRVPAEPRTGASGGLEVLVMEAVEEGARRPETFADFGHRFAELHRRGRGERYGFDHDNFLGATPQPNAWCDDWATFFRDHRLGFQLDLARRRGRSDRELDHLGDHLLGQLNRWLDVPGEPPCLLHGDLWSGNYLIDEAGAPVLIDPAVYYGHREADLAMTRLFGGFQRSFYDAYEEAWPLAAGAEERLPIYQLYHLLNHLNLFGGSYRNSCLGVLRRLVG